MSSMSNENEYLQEYEQTAVLKPQVVADNVLAGIFLADARHRVALAALLMQETVEAARRFAQVCGALADRSVPVARALAAPLPGAAAWTQLAETIGAMESPRQVLDWLHVDASAAESAEEVLAFGGLSRLTLAIRVFESGPPTLRLDRAESTPTLVIDGHDADGAPVEARLPLADEQVIALGDTTGDLVTWTRDFLGAYIDARAPRA